MKGWIAVRWKAAIAAAASLSGRRFGLLVASSVVATSALVAAGLTAGPKDNGPLATLVGRSLAAQRISAAEAEAQPEPEAEAAPEPEPEEEIESSPEPEPEVESLPEIESAPEIAPEPVEEEPAPEPEPEPEEETAPPAEEKPTAGQVKHVFVVNLASSGYASTWGTGTAATGSLMPYLSTTLRPQGLLLTNYKLLNESWLANSFASVGGRKPTADAESDCPKYEACLVPAEELSIADQLGSALFTWRGYFEGMADTTGKPASCVHPEPGAEEPPALGAYAAYLNPFVYFHSLLDLGECSANDVPLTELEKDLKKTEKTPNFSYVQPDLCDSGVLGQCAPGAPEGAAAADAWLATWIPKIMKSPAYKKDGLIVVTFGAVNPIPNAVDPTQPPTPPTSLKTGALLVSHFIAPGATDGTRYDPYSLLATTEDLFGLNRLGEAGGKKVKSLGAQLRGEEETSGGD